MNSIISDTKVLANDFILKDRNSHSLPLLPEFLNLFDEVFTTPSYNNDGYYDIIRSRIPSRLVSMIHQLVRSKHLAISITVKICLFFLEKIYDNVWKSRCNLIIEKEQSEGITKKDKRLRDANKHGNKFSDF